MPEQQITRDRQCSLKELKYEIAELSSFASEDWKVTIFKKALGVTLGMTDHKV